VQIRGDVHVRLIRHERNVLNPGNLLDYKAKREANISRRVPSCPTLHLLLVTFHPDLPLEPISYRHYMQCDPLAEASQDPDAPTAPHSCCADKHQVSAMNIGCNGARTTEMQGTIVLNM